jgi:hypothetical protein
MSQPAASDLGIACNFTIARHSTVAERFFPQRKLPKFLLPPSSLVARSYPPWADWRLPAAGMGPKARTGIFVALDTDATKS